MARTLQVETMGKDSNGKYSEQFKNDLRKCIAEGLNSLQAAEKLGVEPLGSGYRQLYYKLTREFKEGKYLPTMKVSGISSTKKVETDNGIKTTGADTSDLVSSKSDKDAVKNVVKPIISKSISAKVKEDKKTVKPIISKSISDDVKDNKETKSSNQYRPISNISKQNNTKNDYIHKKDDIVKEKETIHSKSEISKELLDDAVDSFKQFVDSPSVSKLESEINSKISSLETEIELKVKEIDDARRMIKFLEYLKLQVTRG